MQEPKSVNTKTLKRSENNQKKEPMDRSASTSKRGRIPHSNRVVKTPNSKMKEVSSRKSSTANKSRNKVSDSNLRTYVLSKLDQYKENTGLYNGIIRILADVGYLQYCYMLIKGRSGNMSPGVDKTTLDGITKE